MCRGSGMLLRACWHMSGNWRRRAQPWLCRRKLWDRGCAPPLQLLELRVEVAEVVPQGPACLVDVRDGFPELGVEQL